MNILQAVRKPIVISFMAGAVAISPAAVELCSTEPSMPHTHMEIYTVASSSSLTYVISGTTTGTAVINKVFNV